MDVERRIIK